MRFDHHIPTKLKGLSTIIWEQQANKPLKWQILPSGYIELVFRIGPPTLFESSSFYSLSSLTSISLICGMQTNPLYFNFNRFYFMGVQLHPVALKPIFGIPAYKLVNQALEGQLAIGQLKWIEERLSHFTSFNERAHWLESWIYNKINETPELWMMLKLDRFIDDRLKETGENQGTFESQIGFSRAHTHRLFKDWLGFSPGKYLRLKKYINSISYLHHTSQSLSNIAYEAGFYDQAQFIRTFREFTNLSPKEYRQNMSTLPGQLVFK